MLRPTSKTFTMSEFLMSSGVTLTPIDIAYKTWGTLNAAGSNGILLCHGYTKYPHAGPMIDAVLWETDLSEFLDYVA